MRTTEKYYLFYRKTIAAATRLVFLACSLFPVQKNKIVICTFEGKTGFGCNPKYIVEELHRRNSSYRFVWLVNDTDKEFPQYIKKKKNNIWNGAWQLSTAKIWIDNYRKPYGTRKRKSQYYFQTWHGTIGFKSTGLWRGTAFSPMAYLVSKSDSDMIDYVTIDSEWCRQMFPKGLVYDGEFLKVGAPRCDVLYGDRKEQKKKFLERFGLGDQARIIMFAPTFREGSKNGVRTVFSEEWSVDFERMLKNLEKRFGGEWHLCVRIHPQLSSQLKQVFNPMTSRTIIDVSKDDDMYEVLAAMDALITDYSSVAMDAGFTHMPVFIYADDIDCYIKDRGSILWNLSSDSSATITNNKKMTPGIEVTLPYSVSQNNEELEKNILEFDKEIYEEKLRDFECAVGLVFDGKASERTADKIEDCMRH